MVNCAPAAAAAIAAVLVAVLVAGQPTRPLAADLQPHRAVYRMSLAGAERPGEVSSATGAMVYQFSRGCDGWTVENRTMLRLGYENDSEVETAWTFVSWESLDGSRFRFRARYDQDGQTVEKIAGSAELRADGAGEARFSEPEARRVELPAGSLFPTAHIRAVLAAGAAGGKSLNRVVFDGASLDNPYQVNAFFGPLAPAATEALAKAAGLAPQPGWWTRMAFFPLASPAALPEFEIDAQYRADGVADVIRQSFERFALDVRLHQLEVLPPPDC
jgi:hypothetical protein